MGYRVEYGSVKKVRGSETRAPRAAAFTALFFLLFLLLVNTFWPQGAEMLRDIVLPGDPAVTAAALEEFTMELKDGAKLSGAFTAFCQRILADAGIG